MQALWMLLAAFLFAAMGACIKLASTDFNSWELVFWRGVLGIVIMAAFARARGVSLKTRYPGMHAWRSAVGVTSLGAWFYAIANLPLGTAMTLNYMSSVWIAAFLVGGALIAWTPQRQRALSQGPLAMTVLAGFAGVVLMLRPSVEQNQALAASVGLLSGVVAAFAYMQVMALARAGEPEERTVFYFAVGTLIAGGLGIAFTGFSPWRWAAAVWLLPIGLLASIAQVCMTRAYSNGATLLVANLQYSGIVFGALFGIAFFGDHLPPSGWLGMALIIGSGVWATILRKRAAPDAPAEEH